jgi:tRNA(Arg) A34 adenosine deaminase TadA
LGVATLGATALGVSGLGVATLGAAMLPIAPRTAHARAVQVPATQDDERLMRLALAQAARGDYPFGAVITRNGKVLSKGRNLGKQRHDPTAHGEMVAIRTFLKAHGPDPLKGTTLYTSGEPCCMCMGAIAWCGIGRLVYAASMDQLATKIEQIMVPSAQVADKTPFATIDITGGVLAAEAMALFK